jgi:hypothetical protein
MVFTAVRLFITRADCLRSTMKAKRQLNTNWHSSCYRGVGMGISYGFRVQMETQGRIDRGVFTTGLEV